jgi:hypothetical protein
MRFALSLLLAAAATIAIAAGAAAQAPGPSVRMLVQSSPLAGYRHHEAAGVWHLLRIGDRLELVREPDNPHDTRAIRVDWRGHKLGYVPRRENDAVAWGLDRGDVLLARISRLDERRPASRRLEFEVYVE